MSDHDDKAVDRLTNVAGDPPAPPPLHLCLVGGMWLVGALYKAEDGTPVLSPVWQLSRTIAVDERTRRLRVRTECSPVAGLASLRVFPLHAPPSVLLPLSILAPSEREDVMGAIAACEQIVRSMLADSGRAETAGPSRIIVPGS